ncbi:MAG: hypothetical protein ISR65_08120 [Bacteriovoracaceae bacterium]|nr:hypothetical protein [Bacteriovoracaceae bacterium]
MIIRIVLFLLLLTHLAACGKPQSDQFGSAVQNQQSPSTDQNSGSACAVGSDVSSQVASIESPLVGGPCITRVWFSTCMTRQTSSCLFYEGGKQNVIQFINNIQGIKKARVSGKFENRTLRSGTYPGAATFVEKVFILTSM